MYPIKVFLIAAGKLTCFGASASTNSEEMKFKLAIKVSILFLKFEEGTSGGHWEGGISPGFKVLFNNPRDLAFCAFDNPLCKLETEEFEAVLEDFINVEFDTIPIGWNFLAFNWYFKTIWRNSKSFSKF